MVLNSLSLATELTVEGKKIKVDFSDRKFVNRVLRLMDSYDNINSEIKKKIKEVESKEYANDVKRYLAYSDIETKVLEDFKLQVNETFKSDVTGLLYGDLCEAPDILRYFPLMDELGRAFVEAKEVEAKALSDIANKYGLDRISGGKVIDAEDAFKPDNE